MNFKAILILAVLMSSCSQLENANSNSFPTPTNFELAEKKSNQSQSEEDYAGKLSPEQIKQKNQDLKEELSKLAKSNKLPVLEKTEMPNDDLEARIWRHSGWWQMWLLVLKRSNGKWSANFQEQTFDEETDKVKKTSKRRIGAPQTDWENVWKKMTNEELLTLPSGFENNGWLPCPDCGNVIIETKVGENYRFYAYTEPVLDSDIQETRRVAKIMNIVAEEFDIKEFKAAEPICSK
jgi:hypothetical protein